MATTVHINSMDGDRYNYRYNLKFEKENSKSIYCKSTLYGKTYRIEKATGKVFCDGKQIADTSEWEIL